MQSRKRKADDEDLNDGDTLMSRSPSASPLLANGALPQGPRAIRPKRIRSNLSGRQLNLPRLLQTLSQDELRSLLQNICDRHPDLNAEITNTAPRPGVDAVLGVLGQYEAALRAALPFGANTSDYAYNRVRQPLADLVDALRDYTPTFLPPNEPQTGLSLKYLDAATNLIHRLPDFENYQNNRVKLEAYEEISRAWAVVIQEAAKRGGGIQLRIGDWEQKLARHHQISGNRLEEAVQQFQTSLNWMAEQNNIAGSSTSSDQNSIRQQLLSGTFGMGESVRIGPW
jgi:protein Cut8